MSVVAAKDGVMAADSRITCNGLVATCTKIFRRGGDLIGVVSVDDGAGLLFLDWYKSGRSRPEILVTGDADFYALVLDEYQRLFLYDKWCRGEQLREKFFAIGTGADLAMGAMEAGKTAPQAARIACKRDMHCGLPVVFMRL